MSNTTERFSYEGGCGVCISARQLSDCLSENQPSSHLRFYQVNGLYKPVGMPQKIENFSNDKVMFVP